MKTSLLIAVLLIIGVLIWGPIIPRANAPFVGGGCVQELTGNLSLYTRIQDQQEGKRSFVDISQSFCIDHQKIYFIGKEIEGVDIHSFSVVVGSELFAFDNKNIYYKDKQIYTWIAGDSQTLKYLGNGYLTNGKSLWGGAYLFKDNVDIESFVPITFTYSKDKDHVYYGADLISGADVKSFKVLSGEVAEDNTNIYKYGLIIAKPLPQK